MASSVSVGKMATPRLAEMLMVCPSMRRGFSTAVWMASTKWSMELPPARSLATMMNSSPPRRARVSDARTLRRRLLATSRRTRSPAWWPRESWVFF
jgi:hypothetical protein